MPRILQCLLVLLATVLLLAHVTRLLGVLYELATDQFAGTPPEAAAETAVLAARLTPWSSHRQVLAGRLAAEAGLERSESFLVGAMKWAPGNALPWAEYALYMGRIGRLDDAILPTSRALALAPQSPAVNDAMAAAGLAYWEAAPEALRTLWVRSFRFQLEHHREEFLLAVMSRGRLSTFCTDLAPRLGERAWCSRNWFSGNARRNPGSEISRVQR